VKSGQWVPNGSSVLCCTYRETSLNEEYELSHRVERSLLFCEKIEIIQHEQTQQMDVGQARSEHLVV